MVDINRRSLVCPIGIPVTLATADDLAGVQDNTKAFDITGALRVLVWQIDDGTGGTAGIDVVEISHDGGLTWTADSATVLPVAQPDVATAAGVAGVLKTAGALNAAGTEPATVEVGLFKCGPYEGPTAIRIGRDTSNRGTNGTGTDWVTGAPTVLLIPIGLTGNSVSALA
jgi:hypothetical protein